MNIFTLSHYNFRTLSVFMGALALLFCVQLHASDQGSFTSQIKGKGEAVLLIPGLMSDASVFDSLATDLSKNYEVHLISVKGFASTPGGNSFSLNRLVQDIVSYSKSLRYSVGAHPNSALNARLKDATEENPLSSAMTNTVQWFVDACANSCLACLILKLLIK